MKPLAANKPTNLLPPVSRYRFEPEVEYSYFDGADEYPFEPDVTHFRLVNAWWLMDASMLAYSKEHIIQHWCRRAGFSRVEWFSHDGTQCYIAIHEKYVFVVFRGTDPPSRFRNFLIDWNINFQMTLIPSQILRGSIHHGFHKALEKVSVAEAGTDGYGVGLQLRLREISRENPNARFWFTGHSQGAALAALAVVHYVHAGGDAQLYTFASPKVGDQTFAQSFDVPAWRVVNSTDIITRLPLFGFYSRVAGLFKWPLFGCYGPVGELRFIDDRGNIGPKEVVHKERFRIFTYLQHKWRKFKKRFSNHAPIHYAVHIKNAMVNAKTQEFPVSSGVEPEKWGWLRWALVIGLCLWIGFQGLLVGIRWWIGYPPDIPPAAVIIENGLGADRDEFYTLPEGSEMFPLAVAQSIRLPKGDLERLSRQQPRQSETNDDPEPASLLGRAVRNVYDYVYSAVQPKRTRLLDNLELFGFIKVPANTEGNRLGYVGLTVSRRDGTGVEMLGVNCAACHVGQLNYKGKAIRVDGAPNTLDVFGFVNALSKSSKLINLNPFILFKEGSFWLKEISFNGWSLYRDQVNRNEVLQHASTTAPLNGRADAFGTARAMFFGDFRQLTSPASYPHLWGLDKTAWYHWNANTNSVIERNIGEALGLGAGFDPKTCKTTIKFDALERLENLASKITAPSWPAEFGGIDGDAVGRGENIYLKECAGCHDSYEKGKQGNRPVNDYNLYTLNEVGTDPNEALNFVPSVKVNRDLCNDKQGTTDWTNFGAAHEKLIGGVRFDSPVDVVANPDFRLNRDRGQPKWTIRAICEKGDRPGFKLDNRDCPVYPAKPLVGIWATAPYLHNGSVASIMELLTPPAERLTKFAVGQREYDPVNLGYSQRESEHFNPKAYQVFDTRISGNSNLGHDYGTKLAAEQKRDLIEFLKSLKEGDQERLHTRAYPPKVPRPKVNYPNE